MNAMNGDVTLPKNVCWQTLEFLVINFGERLVSAGIHRVVNCLPEEVDFNAKPPRRRDAKRPDSDSI